MIALYYRKVDIANCLLQGAIAYLTRPRTTVRKQLSLTLVFPLTASDPMREQLADRLSLPPTPMMRHSTCHDVKHLSQAAGLSSYSTSLDPVTLDLMNEARRVSALTVVLIAQCLERDVAVLAPWVCESLGREHVEVLADAAARGLRLNHIINVATLGGWQWVAKCLHVLLLALC